MGKNYELMMIYDKTKNSQSERYHQPEPLCQFLNVNLLTKNEQKKMKDTKYAYASEDPHESPSFFAFGSHGLPLRHASIIFGHDSPVAHLEYFEIIRDINVSSRRK